MKKKLPFDVPKNYFDELTHRIKQRAATPKKHLRVSYLFSKPSALVAGIVLILCFFVFFPSQNEHLSSTKLLSAIDADEIDTYLESDSFFENSFSWTDFSNVGEDFEINETGTIDLTDENDFYLFYLETYF